MLYKKLVNASLICLTKIQKLSIFYWRTFVNNCDIDVHDTFGSTNDAHGTRTERLETKRALSASPRPPLPSLEYCTGTTLRTRTLPVQKFSTRNPTRTRSPTTRTLPVALLPVPDPRVAVLY